MNELLNYMMKIAETSLRSDRSMLELVKALVELLKIYDERITILTARMDRLEQITTNLPDTLLQLLEAKEQIIRDLVIKAALMDTDLKGKPS